MKKMALAATALSALSWVGPSFSADLPVKAPRSVPVPVISWTGCHVGGHVGGGWGTKDWSTFTDRFATLGSLTTATTVTNVSTPGGNTSTTTSFPFAAIADPINSFSEDTAGFLGGGQIGCDFQFAPRWVVGIEGAGSWASLTANENISVPSPIAPGSAQAHARVDRIFSVTGRIGYTPIDTLLLYVRGGAAWARDSYNVTGNACSTLFNTIDIVVAGFPPTTTITGPTSSCGGSTSFNFGATQDRFGWTAGLGLEMMIWKNTSWFVEYNAYDFGTKHVVFSDSLGASSAGADIRQWVNAVRVGVNFRFGS
jgi:outer membrane immunogenic protein